MSCWTNDLTDFKPAADTARHIEVLEMPMALDKPDIILF